VVWRPGWNAVSLLPDYPRQSCLSGVSADSKLVLQQRHKGQRKRNGLAYTSRQTTRDAAKRYLEQIGA
jgi:hypothetical protein